MLEATGERIVKGFSDSERDRIRQGLLKAGREMFSTFGIERTRISDLTDEVGIAQSTFYQFFDSKEALYFEVLRREQRRIADGFETAVADAPDMRSEVIAGFEFFFSELESNQLYYKLIVMDDLEQLFSGASEAELESFYDDQLETIEPHVQRWTEADGFRIDDPAELVGIFRMLAYTIVAKDRFENLEADIDGFDSAHETLVEAIADGLFTE